MGRDKTSANSDQDDGEDSGNFTQPTIQTVNTSTATADTNGSGDDYVHFPYWSRLTHHGNEFAFNNDTLMIHCYKRWLYPDKLMLKLDIWAKQHAGCKIW